MHQSHGQELCCLSGGHHRFDICWVTVACARNNAFHLGKHFSAFLFQPWLHAWKAPAVMLSSAVFCVISLERRVIWSALGQKVFEQTLLVFFLAEVQTQFSASCDIREAPFTWGTSCICRSDPTLCDFFLQLQQVGRRKLALNRVCASKVELGLSALRAPVRVFHSRDD